MTKHDAIMNVHHRLLYWNPLWPMASRYTNWKNLQEQYPILAEYQDRWASKAAWKVWVWWKFSVVLPLTDFLFRSVPNNWFPENV